MREPVPGKIITRKSGFFTITEPENQKEIRAYEKWVKKRGYVYIGKTTNKSGEYKIGSSRNIIERERTLKIGNPFFSILYVMESMDCLKSEREVQRKFNDKKISGEWFCLSNEDMMKMFSQYKFEVYKRE